MNQPIFADDATTVVHFTGWDYVGGTLTPKTGLPWTTVGTVPSSTGIGRVTKGIGPFDDSDYLKLGTGTDALDFVGHSSWAIAVLLKVPPHANQPVYLSDGQAGVAGWYAQLDAANQCVLAITGTGGTAGVYGGGSDPLSNGLQECCFGISGATAYARRGLNATVTGDISTTNYTPATSLPAELGRYNAATSFGFGGNVVELIASATADPASWCAARGHDVVARSGVRFVAAHGDSITYGWLVGPSRLTTPYPLALGNALGPGWAR